MKARLNRYGVVLGLLALFTSFLSPAQATHLRGAIGSVVYNHTANTVTITSTNVARKDACATLSATNSLCTFFAFPKLVQVDRVTGAQKSISACSGQATTPVSSAYDTTTAPLYNIFTTTYVIDVACPTFSKSFDYIFSQTGANRIGGIRNTSNQVIQFEGKIRIDGTTDRKAPIYNSGYLTNVTYNESPSYIFSTSLNATGQNAAGVDGYGVTYALVTSSASAVGGYGATPIPCSNFNTSTGVLQIGVSFCTLAIYQAAFKGGTDAVPIYYAYKTIAYDALGQYTTRDVLLSFSSTSNIAPTLTRSPATNPITLTAGATTTYTYTASDSDTANRLIFSGNSLPAWATVSVPFGQLSTTNPKTMVLTLSPPSGTNYAGTILISVTDNAGYPLSVTNQLDISVGTGLLPPGSPGRPMLISSTTESFTAPTTGGVVASYSALATPLTGSGSIAATSCDGSTLVCTFPSSITNYTVVVTATNAVGSANSLPSIVAPVLYISNSSLSWTQNTAPTTNYTLSQAGQSLYIYSISPALPAGLTFSTSTGLITGTPSETVTAKTFTITGSTGGSTPATASVTFTLTIAAAVVSGKINQTITFPKMGQFPRDSGSPTLVTPSNPDTASATLIYQPINSWSSSGLPISYTVTGSSGSYCQKVQGTGTNTGTWYLAYIRSSSSTSTSTCSVKATQAGNGTYNAASSVTITVQAYRSGTTYTAAPGMGAITLNGGATSLSIQTGQSTTTTGIRIDQALLHNYAVSGNSTSSKAWTYCEISPAPPAGLKFGPFTCQLSGVPTAAVSSATYTITYRNPFGSTAKTFTMEVVKGSQTITFPAISDTNTSVSNFSPGATNSVSLASGGEAISYRTSNALICTIVDNKIHPVSSGNCTVTASASSNANYNAAVEVARTFYILGAPSLSISSGSSLEITASVGEYSANFFPTTNGGGTVASWTFKNETGTVLTAATLPMDLIFDTATGVLSGSFEESQDRTGYYITATNAAGSSNIHIYMTAIKIDQTITFSPLNGMAVGDPDQGLFATASSGLAIAFTTNSASICTIVSGKVHAVGAGLCKVTAAQSAFDGTDPTYNAAVSVSRQFSISAALVAPDISLTDVSATVSVNQPLPWLFDVLNSGGKVAANGYSISPSPSTISDTATVIVFDTNYGVFSSGTPNRVGTTVFTITANNAATPGGVGASKTTFTLNVVAAPDTLRLTQLGEMIAGTTADASIVASTISGRTGITYTASPSSVCTIVSNKVHAVGYGTCLLAAHINADSTWSAADASINIAIHAPPKLTLTGPVTLIGGATYTRTVIPQTYVGDPATKFELWDSTGSATNYTNLGIYSLTFNSTTGALTGTVTSLNQSATTYRVKVTNVYGTDSATVSIAVTGLTAPVISISNPDLTAYDQAYEFGDDFIIINTGQPATDYILYNQGTTTPATLPAGLLFDTSAGVIVGTATTAVTKAKTSYDFYAHNAAGNSNKVTVSLTMIDPVSVSTTVIDSLTAGSPYTFALVPAGGFGAKTWTTETNTANTWLTVDLNGNLVGTPPAASSGATYSIYVSVTDAGTAGMGGPSVSSIRGYTGTIKTNSAATDPATNIASTSATLNGSTALSGALSKAFFCYSTTLPGTSPNNTFAVTTASRTTKSCTTSLSSHSDTTTGTISPFGAAITGLTANTTYYYQFFINVGGSAAANEYSGTVKSFKTYAASYTITASAGANGTISSDGDSTVTYGGSKTYTITPADHYHIASVLVDGVEAATAGTPATYTFSAVNAAHTISATFAPDVYTVTFDYTSANTGKPSLTSVKYIYLDPAFNLPTLGNMVRGGYTFVGWNTTNGQTAANKTSPYTPTADITLYSAWTPDYSINFDKGTGQSGALDPVSGSGTSVTLPAFSTGTMAKTGYHFGNWLSGDGTNYADSAVISLSTPFTQTLTAQWVANIYSVTYDPNGGSVDTSTATFTVDGAALTLRTPTRTGYTFNGWYTAMSGGTKAPSSYSPMESIKLFAQWTLLTYTITYSAGAGATGADVTQTFSHFSSVNIFENRTNTTNFTYAGKYFNGWKDGSGNSYGVKSLYATYSDITLIAQWADVAKFKVIYNPNAVDIIGSPPVDSRDYMPGETATVTLRPSMTRPGYSFVGWNTNPSGTGTAYAPGGASLRASTNGVVAPLIKGSLNSGLMVSGAKGLKSSNAANPFSANITSDSTTVVVTDNLILFAIWGPLTYSVTYNADGGTVSPLVSSFVSGSGAISLPLPTKTGYTFDGWYTAGNVLVGKANTDYSPVADIILYAHWTGESYLIDFDANGGPNTPATATFVYGGAGISLTTPTWTGRTFSGWYTSALGGTLVTSPYSPSASGTLFARWSLITYTVTYDPGLGSVTPSSALWSYGGGDLVLPPPTRDKYSFDGWYTSDTGGTLIGHDSDPYEPSSNIRIYAHWTLITYPYQVAFNYGSGGSGSQATMTGNGVQLTLTALSTGSIAKAGANFDYWQDEFGTVYEDGEVIPIAAAFTRTLTANWADILFSYNVTFDKGTGTAGSLADKTGTGTSFSLPTFASGTMVKPGYVFANWLSESGTAYANGATIRIISDFTQTLIAQWTPGTYTVTYDPRGGTVDTTTATYTTGNSALVLVTPTLAGSTFNGWYTAATGGTRVGGAADRYSPVATINIYAQWSTAGSPPPPAPPSREVDASPDPIPAPVVAPKPVKLKASKLQLQTQSTKPAKGSLTTLKQILDDESAVVNSKNAKVLSQGDGLLSVKVSLTEISVTPKLNYSGISEVIVELTSADTKETITVQVTVNPAGPSNPIFTPTSPKLTSITWKSSPSATSYEVKIAESVVCTSKTTTCSVAQLLGPKAVINVNAIGNDRTSSEPVLAGYVNKKPITALVVNFATGSSVLSSTAKAQLRSIAKTVVEQGFSHFVVSGHTDSRGGVDNKALSLARATETFNYLSEFAPSLDVKLGAFASTKPAKPGKSAAAYAANRRAELGVY